MKNITTKTMLDLLGTSIVRLQAGENGFNWLTVWYHKDNEYIGYGYYTYDEDMNVFIQIATDEDEEINKELPKRLSIYKVLDGTVTSINGMDKKMITYLDVAVYN